MNSRDIKKGKRKHEEEKKINKDVKKLKKEKQIKKKLKAIELDEFEKYYEL